MLDTLGLHSPIEIEARRFRERTGTSCVIKPSTEMPALSPEVTTTLFRVFQECLTNVARHSGATEVETVLELTGNDVHLCVTDNGRGMADIERVSTESLGLLGIRERVNLLGGRIKFSSAEGRGTTIDVRVPRRAHAELPTSHGSAPRVAAHQPVAASGVHP